MHTTITTINPLDFSLANLKTGVDLLTAGQVVGLPTETVYGLAANGLDPLAVKKIFLAKGRPQDNPLILHISNLLQLPDFARDIPDLAYQLAEAFWPGPLTLILKRRSAVPPIVSAGLDTVAIRLPAHPVARRLIAACGFPLAAPSANRSGSPSPTSAAHVLADLSGRIPLILDGGACLLGLESTVISLTENRPRLLRPGSITPQQLLPFAPDLQLDDGLLQQIHSGQTPASPGMKYRHYAPHLPMVLFFGSSLAFADFCKEKEAVALCFDEDLPDLSGSAISMGSCAQLEKVGQNLFGALRRLDEFDSPMAAAHAPEPGGLGLSLLNRLLRSAGFQTAGDPLLLERSLSWNKNQS